MSKHCRTEVVVTLITGCAMLVSCSSAKRPPVQPNAVSAATIRPRPKWLAKTGLVVVDYMEPLMFRQRMGGWGADVVNEWNEIHTEKTIKSLKEMGVNLIITTLHKGFGLKAEQQEIEATRKLTEMAHRYGIRVGGYIGATMMYETFFAEEPASREWMQVNEWGWPIYYTPQQTWRYMACRNNPGYQAFVQKVLRVGIEDLKLDMMHFDQVAWWPEPRSCHCKYCRDQFRAFLRSRYDNDHLKLRIGFTRLDDIGPPPFDLWSPPVQFTELTNPVMQDWTRFRCASLAQRWAEYDNFIQKLNPEVALIGNPNVTVGMNHGFISGIDVEQLMLHGDGVWDEARNYAAWTDDGRLISKIPSYKAARIMGQSLYVYHGRDYHQRSPQILSLAEAMAYNDMNLGVVAADDVVGAAVPQLTAQAKRYIEFFHSHAKDLAETTSIADAAVFHSFPSIEFNPSKSNLSTVLFEQTLIQTKIPFQIIFSRHLKDLSKYKVLVLANQDALSDDEITSIRKFVENGGGLVATESSSLLTDWRLRRNTFGLADLFGIPSPLPPDQPGKVVQRSFGNGRVAYIPRIELSTNPPPPQMNYNITSNNWKLPKNYEAMAQAVRWTAKDDLSVNVTAPLSVTLELAGQRQSETRLLHLLNYNFSKPVSNIGVTLRLPAGLQLQECVVDTPDEGGERTLKVSPAQGGSVSFTVPRLEVYDLILLRMAGKS